MEDLGFDPGPFVRQFALSPDERRLATATWGGSLWVYDLARGTRVKLPSGDLAHQVQPARHGPCKGR